MARARTRTFHEAGQTLTLIEHSTHVELMIGHVPILSSAVLGTEREFGELAKAYPQGRIIIGGLGFGSTLGGVLASVSSSAEVIVVEKLKTVVKLVQGDLRHLAHGALEDPRVKLVRDDIRSVIAKQRDVDLILLDVDNGPEWASFTTNAGLYDEAGLRAAMNALRSKGTYAVWAGYPCDGFLGELESAGFEPSVVTYREKGKVQARAYLGRKP